MCSLKATDQNVWRRHSAVSAIAPYIPSALDHLGQPARGMSIPHHSQYGDSPGLSALCFTGAPCAKASPAKRHSDKETVMASAAGLGLTPYHPSIPAHPLQNSWGSSANS